MAYSGEIDDIPKSTVRAVAKKLKHYIDVQRREEAFDLSGVQHMMGSFTSSKGGSLYYDAMQEKFLLHYLSQPHLSKRAKEMGLKPRSNSTPRPISAMMNYTKQEETQSRDNTKLVHTASKMLLTSNVKHLNRTGSAINHSAPPSATRRLVKPSSTSSRPSSASTISRGETRRKRPHRRPKQSTPKVQAASLSKPLDETNLQPLLQRPDFSSSSISSKASSSQSIEPQSPEDDELLHYTVHSISKNQSFTASTLLTKSDSALCMPVLQRRPIKNKQAKGNKITGHQDVPAGPTTSTLTEHSPATSNHPLETSSQVLYKVTQDASTQVEETSSVVPSQSVMMAQSISSVGRIPVVTSSMQSIGLQVTECNDASTQTLNEVGIQTDLSAIMDQKRAERIKMKKQARKSSRTSTTSEVPTVVITGPTDLPSNEALTNVSDPQNMEAARKEEELRRQIAATTIQQYYRGFKSGVRAKKSEQTLREQEPVVKKLPVGPSIHEAACAGNIDRIKELSLEASSLMNFADERGYTPLHCAAEIGSLESVKMLSICGADMQKETPTGYTAIHIAALSGHVNCLKLLHALDCSLRCQTVDKKTPLHLAAMRGHLECCKWLLSNRAKLTVKDENDRTPLKLAIDNKQTSVVELLTNYENELKYAKGALKQLRARRSNSTEGTDDEGWLSDTTKQPDSTNIRSPGSIPATIVEEQRQLYEQIQKDKDKNDSTFLDVARIAVEREIQNQPDQQIEQPDQPVKQSDQHTKQPDQRTEQLLDQQTEQPVQQVEQPDQHSELLDLQTEQHDQRPNQQVNQPDEQVNQKSNQQSEHSGDGQNEVDHLNGEESNTKVSPDHTGGDDATQQTTQQTLATPPIASQPEEKHKDETVATEQPKSGTPEPSNIQEITTVEEDTTVPVVPPEVTSELTTQHQNESTTEQPPSPHTPTDTQGTVENEVPTDPTTTTDDQEDNSTNMIAELSMENVAAHDIAYPPVLERNTTQQTLTTVTMIDNPIRLEQLSRSSLDSDDSKKLQSRQITQQPSASKNISKEDDIIAIAGTVDTATMKSSISSSSLSNVSALTDEETPTSQ